MEDAKVSCRRARRGNRIATLVHPPRDAESEVAGRRWHELPDAHCARLRLGADIEARLDKRQVYELDRKPLAAEDALHRGPELVSDPEPKGEPLAKSTLRAQDLGTGRPAQIMCADLARKQAADPSCLRIGHGTAGRVGGERKQHPPHAREFAL